MNLNSRIKQLIKEIQKLREVCYPKYNLPIGYLTIFSQSDVDYRNLSRELEKIGKREEANNGFKFKLFKPISESGENIELIRVRKPDVHRKELGCADLIFEDKDYYKLREIALDKGFDVIFRKDYEMIELSDFENNVYAYLVKNL